jgi:hypothetical protein
MKRIIISGIILVTMLASLGGCYWGYPDHGRGGGYDRGDRHNHDRGERRDHDSDRGRDHDDRDGGHDERR